MDTQLSNKYRDRYFASCEIDTEEPQLGKIEGKVPTWIHGSLIRNGPGCFKFGDQHYNHYFDGASLMHRFKINDGVITYQCKFLNSKCLNENRKSNRIVVNQFGTASYDDPCMTIFQRFFSWFTSINLPDNANVNFNKYGDSIYASTETPIIHRVDAIKLCNDESIDVSKYISVFTHTAHAHTLQDGTTLNFGMGFGLNGTTYKLIEFPYLKGIECFEKAKIIATVQSSWSLYPSYFHSFGITENYVIFVEQSAVVSIPLLVKMLFKKSCFKYCLKFYKDKPVVFHVIRKVDGKCIRKITTVPFFFFHTINAYEESGNIILDLCAYQDMKLIEQFNRDYEEPGYIFGNAQSYLWRFILPIDSSLTVGKNCFKVDCEPMEVVKDGNGSVFSPPININMKGYTMELPTINFNNFNGKKYRYIYGVGGKLGTPDFHLKLMKIDLKDGMTKTWSCKNFIPSEPVYIQDPNSNLEDGGVILSSLLSLDPKLYNVICLVILNATTFEEIAKVTFETSTIIPKDIHGIFI